MRDITTLVRNPKAAHRLTFSSKSIGSSLTSLLNGTMVDHYQSMIQEFGFAPVNDTGIRICTRWLSSDSGAFADWVASSSSIGLADDLSLGFNAGTAGPVGGGGGGGTQSTPPTSITGGVGGGGPNNGGGGGGGGGWSSTIRPINYALPVPHEMGMVGLRSDVLFVAPASTFHHNSHHHDPFISDHHHNHNHNHHHHLSINNNSGNNSSATALGIGVIPLLTASPCGTSQLWQNQQTHNNINYPKKSILIHHENPANPINLSNNSAGLGVNVGFGIGGTTTTATTTISASAKTCQDCGNQAKKDCSHSRCRTCCKSRGYDCSTHVKSTWVSAARRRDRQLISAPNTATGEGDGGGGGASSGSTSAVKKPRLITSQTQTTTASHTSNSNTTPPRSFDTTSSYHHQDASFREALPRQVRAPASFKCVRVTPIGDGEDEFAYQAIVKIGGHVFKGFLYNKGVVNGNEGMPNISELHLGGGSSSGGGGGGKTWPSSSALIIDPSDVYAATGSGLFGSGGTNFGNTIN
ncbi:Protein of unknown function DUF702 [Macleaya cordata]|uniref:Zinc finger protein n=1 Tax=Macleaya cordata TaxID=56857 RepID=A0A200R748_MACCD|nr:Protein of unknown function DUF702 [Macleaya cordata]